jgi:hypothetical protein
MKAFKFSLEQLLSYRKQLADSAKLSLAGKVGSINVLQQEIETSHQQARQNFVAARESFEAGDLRQSEVYNMYQVRRRKEAELTIKRLEVERQEVLKLYQERLKGQLVLEHLRDHARLAHKKKVLHAEQIRLDDMINSIVHADNEVVKSGDKHGRLW